MSSLHTPARLHTYTHKAVATYRYVHLDLKAHWDDRDYRISIQIYKARRQIRENYSVLSASSIRVHQRFNQSQDVCSKVKIQKTLNQRLPGREEIIWTSSWPVGNSQQWRTCDLYLVIMNQLSTTRNYQKLRAESKTQKLNPHPSSKPRQQPN